MSFFDFGPFTFNVITDVIALNLTICFSHLFCPFIPLHCLFKNIANPVLFII